MMAALLTCCALVAWGVPAKRGQWRELRLTDGTTVWAQLMGDEVEHYWEDARGNRYVGTGEADEYQRSEVEGVARLRLRMARRQAHRQRRAARQQHYEGAKKGLVILVEYSNLAFRPGHDIDVFGRLLNERGYSEGDFVGSVKDYFYDQSGGKFELDFDVAGPVTLSQEYSYYGRDVGQAGDDVRPGEMVAEACRLVDDAVDFANYDWDGDGEVDQVFVLYAGYGQNDGGTSNTVWPHEWTLQEAMGQTIELDGVVINTYACGSELDGLGNLAGIGTICHEFSHCLGLPDMYDTRPNGTNFGMSIWDLMDQGSYGGDGYCPSGYTSYEKMVCGWQEPTVLTQSVDVANMRPLSEGGETFIIYNDAHKDEYYLLENRQPTGWDADLYGRGLLVLHVDYDEEAWAMNTVNNTSDHQRCTIVHADNSDRSWTRRDLRGDPYPYEQNDSLTNTSVPKTSLFNPNTDGSLLLNKALTGITQNDDGTMSFKFRGASDDPAGIKDVRWSKKDGERMGAENGIWLLGVGGIRQKSAPRSRPKGGIYIKGGRKYVF